MNMKSVFLTFIFSFFFLLNSFAAVYGSESDMRFVYCAAVICYLLKDWSMIDVDKSVQFIRDSLVSTLYK